MVDFKQAPEHHVDRVFILILLTMFAIISFLTVSIGARQYHSIVNNMSANYETRTISAYFVEKINQNDICGSVDILTIDGCEAIVLSQNIEKETYCTYIYAVSYTHLTLPTMAVV